MNRKNILKAIIVLSIIGMAVSGYLLNLHYTKLDSPCDFNGTLQCSLVNRSIYSELFGIPVALLGLIGYFVIGFSSLLIIKNKLTEKIKPEYIFWFSLIALGVSLYLTYAELFILKAVCLFCVISQIDIIAISILAYKLKEGNK